MASSPALVGAERQPGLPLTQVRLYARVRVRIMKPSKVYSATCHQRYSSLRNACIESRTFLYSAFDAAVSALTSFDAFRHASITACGNGRNCVPAAMRRLSAAGLRASYLAVSSTLAKPAAAAMTP